MNIKKYNLSAYYKFLVGLSLVGVKSRARTKLTKDMDGALTELSADEKTLAEEVEADVDETGLVTFKRPEDQIIFEKAQKELREEEVIFEEKTIDQLKKLNEALHQYDTELSGVDANTYDSKLDDLEQ